MFSDENKFDVFGDDGSETARRAKNIELHSKNLRLAVKYGGGSAMVRSCVATSGLASLIIIDGISNKAEYLKTLRELERKTNQICRKITTLDETTIRNIWPKLPKNSYNTVQHSMYVHYHIHRKVLTSIP